MLHLFQSLLQNHKLSCIKLNIFYLILNNLYSFCILVELCKFVPIYCNSIFHSILILWTWNWSVLWLCLYFYLNLLFYFISLFNSPFTFFDSQPIHLYLCLFFYFKYFLVYKHPVFFFSQMEANAKQIRFKTCFLINMYLSNI